ncbi:hypothetical protein NRI58_003491 [Vibrio parahaemolyticus]|nr:hypothetical protein [Vibrio parahaemolyticus]ELB2263785.1 hypothetical protein [Vibrio parahaemolyticus]
MKKYIFRSLTNKNLIIKGNLIAKYEINLTGITYDYSGRLDAEELLELWSEAARNKYPDGMVDIMWLVTVEGLRFKPEFMPGQEGFIGTESFLSYYTHPLCEETGLPLDWATVRVKPQTWDDDALEGLGFIEHVTGWQPSILQTHVSIDFLIEAAKKKSEEVQ